jgi:hypothetical protein
MRTAAARAATGMRSAAAYVATAATNMRTAATSAALLGGRGIGRSRQRSRKNNDRNPDIEY